MPLPAISALRDRWRSCGILAEHQATPEDIVTFERQYGIRMPAAVADYFLQVNGTVSGKWGIDDDGLSGFWHLAQVGPLRAAADSHDGGGVTDLFAFADHSIDIWIYAVRLTGHDEQSAPVFAVLHEPRGTDGDAQSHRPSRSRSQ